MTTPLAAPRACAHCGLPTGDPSAEFCCDGCRAVHDLLVADHLDRYYELRGPRGVPANDVRADRADLKWIDAIEAKRGEAPIARVDLDVQGIHCSACIWVLETLFERRGGAAITVNPSLGRAQLLVPKGFELAAFANDVQKLGYRLGPPNDRPARSSSKLLWRLGVCVAIAMNTMIFAIAIYAGLATGPIHRFFEALNLGLSTISMIVGGGVFFKSAFGGLRRGVLHLDLPIALGVGLAFGGSVYAFFVHRSGGIFVDTLDVFIALMLAGRFLQERVLERNRMALLADDGADGLLARKERDGAIETVPCKTLERGDRIVVASGDLVPVDARLPLDLAGSFSLDWLNGESAPRAFEAGAIVPAGAFNASRSTMKLTVDKTFADSGLKELLASPRGRAVDGLMSSSWWKTLSKVYVSGVLCAATLGFLAWFVATRDLAKSIEVTTAILVVTCPCAFGIATPLAYELALGGLRRAGLYIRTAGFLDRAARVKKVVFDKTGTLTSGALTLRNPSVLATLDGTERAALAELAAATWHPKSVAIARALGPVAKRRGPALLPEEHVGCGVSLRRDGREWRLGAPSFVCADSNVDADLAFGVDGALLAAFQTEEELRPDAAHEVSALTKRGCEVWLLSGDDQARTEAAATAAGIPQSRAIGARTAQEKAAWVDAHDAGDLLMVGDGINDSLVVERATCSGTPAIDRPFMAARSDFYFVTPGLGPVRLALAVADKAARVRSRNLTIALAYNVLSVSLCLAGVMSPLFCAVLMPASSLMTVLTTIASLSKRSSLWKS